MPPTLPIFIPHHAFSEDQIAFSDDDQVIDISDDDQVIDLSDDDDNMVIVAAADDASVDYPPDDHIANNDASTENDGHTATRKYNTWLKQDELKLLDTITDLRKNNMDIMPLASTVLKALQKDGSPLVRNGELNVDVISQKMRHLKNKFKIALKIDTDEEEDEDGDEEQPRGRMYRLPRASHESRLYESSTAVWPELVEEKKARDKRKQARRARTATGGTRVEFF